MPTTTPSEAASLYGLDKSPRKVVLAYSGGLDTSVMLHWIRSTFDCEVVAYMANVGQAENIPEIERKAKMTGASEVWTLDLQDEFVNDYVLPAVRANAVYEGQYLLGTSLARPLIAQYHLAVLNEVGADSVAHGATGKGNDQVRFELGYYALQPGVQVIAPWRLWSMRSRADLIAYARDHHIPIEASPDKPYSCDRNLLHCSYEGGVLEDPWAAAPDDIFTLTCDPRSAPDTPEQVVIEFADGWPVAVNGEHLKGAALLGRLNEIAGRHGVGRIDIVENRFVGMKSRGVYETPGGTLLHAALRAVESITMDREVLRMRDKMALEYAEACYYGFWFAPEMKAMTAFIDAAMAGVTGTARLELYKGNWRVSGRTSPCPLYSEEHVTFEADDVYRQKDAEGFIRLQSLRLKLAAQRQALLSTTAGEQPSPVPSDAGRGPTMSIAAER
ncbi:MAG: argininosuccinate synthase [Acidobacteriota bacterium]|jgi:argininosuccinate synthase